MKLWIYRWPGPVGRHSRDNGFGWHHFHVLPNVVVAWRR